MYIHSTTAVHCIVSSFRFWQIPSFFLKLYMKWLSLFVWSRNIFSEKVSKTIFSGFVWFVLSLVKKYYLRQFSLFAWTHVALLCVVTQSYLIIQNMFQGLIWFIMPIMMVIINDVMAYMFGFFMGRTPLIQLSPKKTWEGFIGGGISTGKDA